MTKTESIEILELIESKKILPTSSMAKESLRYFDKMKRLPGGVGDRFLRIKYNNLKK